MWTDTMPYKPGFYWFKHTGSERLTVTQISAWSDDTLGCKFIGDDEVYFDYEVRELGMFYKTPINQPQGDQK